MKIQDRKGVVLGVDGGGTHSLALAVNLGGAVLASSRGGSLNFFGSGLPSARRNLKTLIAKLRRRLPPGTEFHRIVVGCAALFSAATPAEKGRLCRGILPPGRTRVVSDGDTACFAATLGRPGIVVIAGTGSVVLARTEQGATARAGGWGHLLGDEGSAYWIAVESIKAAVAAEEAGGPKTALGPAICRRFGVKQLTDLVPAIYRPGFGREELARLAGQLARRPGRRDPVFNAICRRAGFELASLVSAALQRGRFRARPVPVSFIGGVLSHNATVRGALASALKPLRGAVRIRPAPLAPVAGAAAMALADAGVPVTGAVVKRLAQAR